MGFIKPVGPTDTSSDLVVYAPEHLRQTAARILAEVSIASQQHDTTWRQVQDKTGSTKRLIRSGLTSCAPVSTPLSNACAPPMTGPPTWPALSSRLLTPWNRPTSSSPTALSRPLHLSRRPTAPRDRFLPTALSPRLCSGLLLPPISSPIAG